jgi:AGZA family xanthine/uracil permease-like MFS transporter
MEGEDVREFFKLQELNTDVCTEVKAGATTFMTMAYIIFVQPAVLSSTGMDFNSVFMAVCISSAGATILMGLLANYPIALAPAMGHNFFFAYTVVLVMGVPWQTVLGAVFISGVIFIILSFFGVRERVIDAIPDCLKNGIAVGIGLLIALVGFEWAGLVVDHPATLVKLGNLKSPPVLLSIFGILLIATLLSRRVKGAILWGIIVTAAVGAIFGLIKFQGVISPPPSIVPTFLKLDIAGAFRLGLLEVIFVFFFLDLFDTVGTLIGVSQEAGFMVNGKLPRANRALLADAVGTVGGSMLGTSTITSYIESAAGVAEGGRSGLANMTTALLFIAAIFFSPLISMVGGGIKMGENAYLYPVTAPALIIVGSIMLKNVVHINWKDYTESIPAFLTMIIMPLTFSITEGIAFGFISYSVLKLLSGRSGDVHWMIYLFGSLFVLRYVFLTA